MSLKGNRAAVDLMEKGAIAFRDGVLEHGTKTPGFPPAQAGTPPFEVRTRTWGAL